MKIRGEIIAVETNGESLHIKMQGITAGAAEWRCLEVQQITIPATQAHQRAFYVGRTVSITVRPR